MIYKRHICKLMILSICLWSVMERTKICGQKIYTSSVSLKLWQVIAPVQPIWDVVIACTQKIHVNKAGASFLKNWVQENYAKTLAKQRKYHFLLFRTYSIFYFASKQFISNGFFTRNELVCKQIPSNFLQSCKKSISWNNFVET